MIKKIISYPVSAIFIIVFLITLIIFHPLVWIGTRLGHSIAHFFINGLNFFITLETRILGTTYSVTGREKIPTGQPVIFVSNHQCMFDVSSMIWYLRKWNPKFVAKKELAKNVPSISVYLNKGGNAVIDRKNTKQAIEAIEKMATLVRENNFAAVIYPEGTRSKTGKPRPFKRKGVKTFLDQIPNALLVPVVINNTYKIIEKGNFPLGLGAKVRIEVLDPISTSETDFETLFTTLENTITKRID